MFKHIIFVLPLIAFIAGCQQQITYKQSLETRGQEMTSTSLLEENGFAMNWQVDMPIKSNENVKYVYRTADSILVLTDRNYVLCYNVESGKLRFIRQISRPGLPLTSPSEKDGIIYTTIGQELWSIDIQSAKVEKVSVLKSPTRMPVQFNSSYAYVIGLDKRISCYGIEDGILKFQVTADNDTEITTAIVSDDYLWFATKQGNVYCSSSGEAKRLWGFNATAEVRAAIVESGDYVYVSSLDTMLYKLNKLTGQLIWKAHLGSSLVRKPVVFDDVVIQQTTRNGMYAIDTESGDVVWNVANGEEMLARNGDRVFVHAKGNVIEAVSIAQKKVMEQLPVENLDKAGFNHYDGKIALVSKEGKLACIEAIRTVE